MQPDEGIRSVFFIPVPAFCASPHARLGKLQAHWNDWPPWTYGRRRLDLDRLLPYSFGDLENPGSLTYSRSCSCVIRPNCSVKRSLVSQQIRIPSTILVSSVWLPYPIGSFSRTIFRLKGMAVKGLKDGLHSSHDHVNSVTEPFRLPDHRLMHRADGVPHIPYSMKKH